MSGDMAPSDESSSLLQRCRDVVEGIEDRPSSDWLWDVVESRVGWINSEMSIREEALISFVVVLSETGVEGPAFGQVAGKADCNETIRFECMALSDR
jgi:hypothetical protein